MKNQKLLKKTLAMLCVASLLLSVFSGISLLASADDTELITNGGFEEYTLAEDGTTKLPTGWTEIPQSDDLDERGKYHPGWSGLGITDTWAYSLKDWDAGISQEIALTAGTYKLSYDRARNGSTAPILMITVTDKETGTQILYSEKEIGSGNMTTAYELFTVTADTTVVISFANEKSSVEIIMDEISLKALSDERIADGTFENQTNDTSPWKRSNVAFDSTNGCVNLMYWSNATQGITQDGLIFVKDEAYELKFDCKNGGSYTRNVNVVITSDDTTLLTKTVTVSSTDYTTYSVKFISDITTTNAQIRFYAPSNTTGNAGTLLDNVSLKKIALSDERIVDGTFENTTDATSVWERKGMTTWSADNNCVNFLYYSNDYYGTTTKDKGGIEQNDVILVGGDMYELKFDCANLSADMTRKVYVRISDGDTVLLEKYVDVSSTDFVTFSGIFAVDTTTFNAKVYFWAPSTPGNGTYLDNVSLVKLNVSDERITNGGFESVQTVTVDDKEVERPTDWNVRWGTVNTQTSLDGFTGEKIIKIANYSGGITQDIILVEGESYILSFKWAPLQADKTPICNISITDKESSATVFSDTPSTTGTANYAVVFKATNTGRATIMFDYSSSSGAFMDDISVKKVEYSLELTDETITMDDNYIYDAVDIESVIAAFTAENAQVVGDTAGAAKTGAKITAYVDNAVLWTKEIVVEGDVNGNGEIELRDLVAMKKQAAGIGQLNGAYLKAGCITGGDTVQGDDITELRIMLLNK